MRHVAVGGGQVNGQMRSAVLTVSRPTLTSPEQFSHERRTFGGKAGLFARGKAGVRAAMPGPLLVAAAIDRATKQESGSLNAVPGVAIQDRLHHLERRRQPQPEHLERLPEERREPFAAAVLAREAGFARACRSLRRAAT